MLHFLTDSWELEEDKEGYFAHSNGIGEKKMKHKTEIFLQQFELLPFVYENWKFVGLFFD